VSNEETGLVRQEGGLPTPAFTGQQMALALKGYKELQRSLDETMPDQLMNIGDKVFRKKGYWRAVNVAFNLNIELVSEDRIVQGLFEDGRENFGYNVTYRATHPGSGRSAVGDGASYAVEKAPKFRCPHPDPKNPNRTLHWGERCPDFNPAHIWDRLPAQATEHNVRSHAHTRAFNRAVSNLVGFGEVSAEEIEKDTHVESQPVQQPAQQTVRNGTAVANAQTGEIVNELPPERAQAAPPAAQQPAQAAQPVRQGSSAGQPGPVISQAQDKRYFALAMAAGWKPDDLNDALKEVWNYDRSDQILKSDYNKIVSWAQAGPNPRG
jgi:hypothetical protein